MAQRKFFDVQGLKQQIKILGGEMLVGATGAVTSQDANSGYTITRSAEGHYTLTLDDPYADILFANAIDILDADTPSSWAIDAYALGSTQTVVLKHFAEASDTTAIADPADGAKVLFFVMVRNTSR